jgi:predicted PurR-regulated permease PerM
MKKYLLAIGLYLLVSTGVSAQVVQEEPTRYDQADYQRAVQRALDTKNLNARPTSPKQTLTRDSNQNAVPRFIDAISNIVSRVTNSVDRIANRSEQLQATSVKIYTRLEQLETEQGVDLSESKSLVIEAQRLIESAQQDLLLAQIPSGEPTQNIENVRGDLESLKVDITKIVDNLQQAQSLLRQAVTTAKTQLAGS